MDSSTHTTEIGTMTLRPDGILHVVFDYDGVLTKEVAADYIAARREFVGSASPPVLAQVKEFPYVDRSIRIFLLSGLPHPPCRAVVSIDPSFITLWRTFELVSDIDVPSEVFASLDLAVEWIHEQMSARDL